MAPAQSPVVSRCARPGNCVTTPRDKYRRSSVVLGRAMPYKDPERRGRAAPRWGLSHRWLRAGYTRRHRRSRSGGPPPGRPRMSKSSTDRPWSLPHCAQQFDGGDTRSAGDLADSGDSDSLVSPIPRSEAETERSPNRGGLLFAALIANSVSEPIQVSATRRKSPSTTDLAGVIEGRCSSVSRFGLVAGLTRGE